MEDCSAPFWANKCCDSNPTALLSHSRIRGQRSFLCGAFAHLLFILVFMKEFALLGLHDC